MQMRGEWGPGASALLRQAAHPRSERGSASCPPASQGHRHGSLVPWGTWPGSRCKASGDPDTQQARDSQVPGTAHGRSHRKSDCPGHGREHPLSADTPCWHSQTQAQGPPRRWHSSVYFGRAPRRPRGGLRVQGRPGSHGNGCGRIPWGLLECTLQPGPAKANIGNFLGIPSKFQRARRRSAQPRSQSPGFPCEAWPVGEEWLGVRDSQKLRATPQDSQEGRPPGGRASDQVSSPRCPGEEAAHHVSQHHTPTPGTPGGDGHGTPRQPRHTLAGLSPYGVCPGDLLSTFVRDSWAAPSSGSEQASLEGLQERSKAAHGQPSASPSPGHGPRLRR